MQMRVLVVLVSTWILLSAGAAAVGQETAPASGQPVIEKDQPVSSGQGDQAGAGGGEGAEGGSATKPADGQTDQGAPRGLGSYTHLFVLVGGFLLLFLWMSRGKKKEQRRRKAMLDGIKKGDKVTTIGGVVGTVMDVKADEVTVKVDESANVRMKFTRWAVRGVGDAAKAENPRDAERS